MARIDLVDMLIQFYRIGVKTTLWNMNVFWHMVDIAKLNAWLLYYRHQKQKCISLKQQKTLVHSSKEFLKPLPWLVNHLMIRQKSHGKPKRLIIENVEPG